MITIYIEEAHPADGWLLAHAMHPATFRQPRSTSERRFAAQKFVSDFGFSLPLYVDTITDKVGLRYQAWPERLLIVVDGVVVYKGGEGW